MDVFVEEKKEERVTGSASYTTTTAWASMVEFPVTNSGYEM